MSSSIKLMVEDEDGGRHVFTAQRSHPFSQLAALSCVSWHDSISIEVDFSKLIRSGSGVPRDQFQAVADLLENNDRIKTTNLEQALNQQ